MRQPDFRGVIHIVILMILPSFAVLIGLTGPGPAYADGCPPGMTPEALPGGTICIPVVDPGTPTTTTPGETTEISDIVGGQQGSPGCTFNGAEIPCTTAQGTWFSAQQCYAQPADPQPPAGEPEWEGHTAAEGSVWQCIRPGINAVWLYFFVLRGETPTLVDPGELAASALGQMTLAVPNIHLAPQAPNPTFVGLETWLWMDRSQFDVLTQTVTAGATSVTVTARPVRATWDLTDGTTTCPTPGRPWTAGLTDAATTDCSYVFEHVSASQPRDQFPVSARLTYEADWTCAGACLSAAGSLGEVGGLPGQAAARVTERQSVVVR